MNREWLTVHNALLCLIMLLCWCNPSFAQNSRNVTKGLEKGAKAVLKEPVKVPGLDLEMAGAKGLGLAQAVNEAINNTVKESLKADLWDTGALSTADLMQVETSATPVSTYLEVSAAATRFQDLLYDNLNSMKVPELLSDMGNDMGFYHSGTPADYMEAVKSNLIAALDNAAKTELTN